MFFIKKNILKKQEEALLELNFSLRQAVSPEKRKYLPPKISKSEEPIKLSEKLKDKYKKNVKIIAVILVFLLLSVFFAVEILILFSKNTIEDKDKNIKTPIITSGMKNIAGNSSGNILNGGLAAEQGDYLYYAANENSYLYRMDKLNGDKTRLVKEAVSFINVLGDTVYYISNQNKTLNSVKIDGTEQQTLTVHTAKAAFVDEDNIYFTANSDGSLAYVNINGGSKTVIQSKRCGNFYVYDSKIIYKNEESGELYYNDIVLKDKINSFCLVGDIVFYTLDDGALFALNLKNNEESPININVGDFNAAENFLVYQHAVNLFELYIKTESTTEMLISDYSDGLTLFFESDKPSFIYNAVDGKRYVIYNKEGSFKRELLN